MIGPSFTPQCAAQPTTYTYTGGGKFRLEHGDISDFASLDPIRITINLSAPVPPNYSAEINQPIPVISWRVSGCGISLSSADPTNIFGADFFADANGHLTAATSAFAGRFDYYYFPDRPNYYNRKETVLGKAGNNDSGDFVEVEIATFLPDGGAISVLSDQIDGPIGSWSGGQPYQPLVINTTSLPDATSGKPYSTKLTSSGGTAPVSWALTSDSSLPGDFKLGSDGTLSATGSPATTPGTYTFNVIATDSLGAPSKPQPLSLKVIGKAITISKVVTPFYSSVDNLNTFISSDTITLTAQTYPLTDVKWTVAGLGAASGITGFPMNEVHTSDFSGVSTFSFSPGDNFAFNLNRKFQWTLGSAVPNTPIKFDVTASTSVGGVTYTDNLINHSDLGQLSQDDTDTLRQEYVDFGLRFNGTLNPLGNEIDIQVPDRVAFVPSLGPNYYIGKYPIQLDENMKMHYQYLLNSYYGMVINVGGQAVTIPNYAIVNISSGYRNPQYNIQFSMAVDSHHTRGSALDVQPFSFKAKINGIEQLIDVTKYLYPALYKAASSAGAYAQAEDATSTKIDGYPDHPVWKLGHKHVISHIHFQWGN